MFKYLYSRTPGSDFVEEYDYPIKAFILDVN